jgi:hypothetical protein
MRHNLGRDFSRLARQSNPSDPRAPWWVNWLLQIGLTALVIWGLAAGLDYAWQLATGTPLGAACGLVALLPIHWLLPVGMLAMLIGAGLALGAKHRGTGLVWFIIGSVLYTTPEIMAALGTGGGCAAGIFQ